MYREYGITSREPGEYEIDHVISLELGGSNSIRNLFPESYRTQPLNAHIKDRLENRLHALTCSGKITMQEAQQATTSNWTVAYEKHLGPLPGGVSVVKTTQAPSSGATSAAPVAVPPGLVGGGLPSVPLQIPSESGQELPGFGTDQGQSGRYLPPTAGRRQLRTPGAVSRPQRLLWLPVAGAQAWPVMVSAGLQDTESGYFYLRQQVLGTVLQKVWRQWGSRDRVAWKSGKVTVQQG